MDKSREDSHTEYTKESDTASCFHFVGATNEPDLSDESCAPDFYPSENADLETPDNTANASGRIKIETYDAHFSK